MAKAKVYETGFTELYFQVLDEDGKTLTKIPGLDKIDDVEDEGNAFRRLKGAKSITSTDESEQTGVLADNDPNYLILSSRSSTSGTLNVVGLSDEFRVAVLGYDVDSYGNVVYAGGRPRMCNLVFTRNTHAGLVRVVLYNVQFSNNQNLDVQTGLEQEPNEAIDFTTHGIELQGEGLAGKYLKLYKIKDTDPRFSTIIQEGAPTEITFTTVASDTEA